MKKTLAAEKKDIPKNKTSLLKKSEAESLQDLRASLLFGRNSEENETKHERLVEKKSSHKNPIKEHQHHPLIEKRQAVYSSSTSGKAVGLTERLIPDFIHEVSSPISGIGHALDNLKTDFSRLTDLLSQNQGDASSSAVLNFIQTCQLTIVEGASHLQEREKRKTIVNWLKGFGFKRGQQGADLFVRFGIDAGNELFHHYFSNENAEYRFELLLSILGVRQSIVLMQMAHDRAFGMVSALKRFKSSSSADVSQEFLLNDTINEAVTLLGHRLRARKFSLKMPDAYKLQGFPAQLTHVWINLISNAIEATDEKGNIALRVFRNHDEIIVSLCDDGEGITTENLTKVFEPYFTTKGERGGTGIGLDICKNYLMNMNAGIMVNSVAGNTEFRVHFKEINAGK